MLRTVSLILSLFCAVASFAQEYVPAELVSVPPRMEVLASESRGNYECRLIEYDTDRSERIRAYLLVPDDAEHGRCPALLMLHDHGARFDIGKEKLVRPISGGCHGTASHVVPEHVLRSSRQWVDKNFDGVWLADSLASLGYVVLASDALYWGDRASDEAARWSELNFGDLDAASSHEDRLLSPSALKDTLKALKVRVYEGQRRVYEKYSSKGDIWAEKILRDDIAATRLLASLPYVDAGNIGAFGFSMGAHRCWLLTAYCSMIKCGAAVSWMTLKSAADTTSASSLSMVIPQLRAGHDYPDIAMRLFPKPMLFLSGTDDRLFPKPAVDEAFIRMREIYGTGGVFEDGEPLLRAEFFEGGHHCGRSVQASVIGFFGRHLKGIF